MLILLTTCSARGVDVYGRGGCRLYGWGGCRLYGVSTSSHRVLDIFSSCSPDRTLADLGANVNTAELDGATPTYIAAQEGHDSTIRTHPLALASFPLTLGTFIFSG